MSIRQQAPIWYSGLSPYQKLVALALADWADDAGRCYPKIRTIADKIGYSPRSVERHIAAMIDIGYITILVPARRHRPPTYQLHPDRIPTGPAAPKPPADTRQPDTPTVADTHVADTRQPRPDNLSPLPDQDPTSASPLPASRPDTGVTPNGHTTVQEIHQEVLPAEAGTPTRIVDESPPAKPRNPLWDAITDLLGPPSQSQTKLQGALVAELADKGVTPDEVRRIGGRIAAAWGPAKLTLGSLRKHWTRFADTNPLAHVTDADRDRFTAEQARQARRARLRQIEGGTE